jgi:glycosyltransferase involved in cell wall biosynthesis
MPFLEAMAMGKVVVAPDLPAMNEYIAHGTNGFLYGKPDPVPLDKEDLQRIAFKAREDICHGFQRWERERDELIPFILNSGYE